MATPAEIAAFAQQYGPVVADTAARYNLNPQQLLSQIALETGYGKSVIPGTNNPGNMKQFGGGGVAATDNALGTSSNYQQFPTLAAGVDAMGSLLARKYGGGSNLSGYAEDPNYSSKISGVGDTIRKYAGDVLGFMTGSGSAQAGELTPAQRRYASAANGPTPPPTAKRQQSASATQQSAPADPTADIFAPPAWAAKPAAQDGGAPQDPTAAIFAPPAWASSDAGGAAATPASPTPAPMTAKPSATPPAAPATSGFGSIGDWISQKAGDLKNLAGNVGMVQAGMADQIDPKTLPAIPSLTQAPPTAPQDRGLLGDAANAFVHHAETPLLGIGQKALALSSALAPIYGSDIAARTSQAAQQLNDDLTKREKFYQADQESGVGTTLGALGGDLAPALLMGPMGGGLMGAMTTGGANALTQPVLDAKSAGDVAKGSAEQAVAGAVLGGAGYGVQKGAGWLWGQGKDTATGILDALRKRSAISTEPGQQSAAEDLIATKLAGDGTPQGAPPVPRSMLDPAPPNMGPTQPGQVNPTASLVVGESPIPGVQRSLAERTMNPEISQLYRSVGEMPGANNPIVQLEHNNQTARNNFFSGLIGDDAAITSRMTARDDATSALYAQARDAVLPVDDHLQAMLDTPAGQNALHVAQGNWNTSAATRGTPFFGGTEDAPTITGRGLQQIKFALDGITNNAMSSDNPATRQTTGELQKEFMQWAGEQNPAYKEANQIYAQHSQPITEMQYLQSVGRKTPDSSGNVQLGRVQTLLDRIQGDQAKPGIQAADSVSDDTVNALTQLRDDLRVQTKGQNLGKAKGSETAQKTATNYLLANANMPTRAAMGALGQAGKSLGTGIGSLFGPAGTAIGLGVGSALDARTAESVAANQQGLLAALAHTLANPDSIAQIGAQAAQRQATQQAAARAAAAAGPATRAQLSKLGLLGAITAGRALGSGQ